MSFRKSGEASREAECCIALMVAAHELSQRRACWLAGLNLSTWQYKPLKRMTLDLRERIIEIGRRTPSF